VAPPGNQAANRENKLQPIVSEETGLLDSIHRFAATCQTNRLTNELQIGRFSSNKARNDGRYQEMSSVGCKKRDHFINERRRKDGHKKSESP
jgi:hypothetical protein